MTRRDSLVNPIRLPLPQLPSLPWHPRPFTHPNTQHPKHTRIHGGTPNDPEHPDAPDALGDPPCRIRPTPNTEQPPTKEPGRARWPRHRYGCEGAAWGDGRWTEVEGCVVTKGRREGGRASIGPTPYCDICSYEGTKNISIASMPRGNGLPQQERGPPPANRLGAPDQKVVRNATQRLWLQTNERGRGSDV
ncbi:hypothetical protein FA13DRAFT_777533 [Coprinellus micaceus]|uniref:Uncharacterized protein n=1 Tax=Coprinellus micaceus TaxID=71717 RepID=A0A4Y7T3E7_COPMI|nr:hypothetical protein FA13DRAFT_777533 [Coprinellus micaceus]